MPVAIVQSANGFARAVSAPLSPMLIAGLNWRGAYLAQGGFMAVAFVLLALLFYRDEAPCGHSSIAQPQDAGWPLAEAVRRPHFWLLSLVYVVTGLGSCQPKQQIGGCYSRMRHLCTISRPETKDLSGINRAI